jgi:hypothetical protein
MNIHSVKYEVLFSTGFDQFASRLSSLFLHPPALPARMLEKPGLKKNTFAIDLPGEHMA